MMNGHPVSHCQGKQTPSKSDPGSSQQHMRHNSRPRGEVRTASYCLMLLTTLLTPNVLYGAKPGQFAGPTRILHSSVSKSDPRDSEGFKRVWFP